MSKQCIGTSHVPLSPAVRAGDFVYVSGQVPFGPDNTVVGTNIGEQTDQTIKNIKAVLEEAGCTLDDVIKTHCYLADARDFGGFNVAYAKHFHTDPPARTTAEARLMVDIKVEIEAIAYKPV